MSRPPVICLKKEEPRSRYVRREVLSVFETFMNFRDLLQVVSAFFVAVRSLVARSRSHPDAFQGFRSGAFVPIIDASGVDAVMSGVDRAGVIKECAAGAMTGRAGRKKELGRCSARKKRLRILHFQIYSVHLHHQNGLCRDGTGESVAQQVEHNTFNVGVLGSSPSGFTKREESRGFPLFFVPGPEYRFPPYTAATRRMPAVSRLPLLHPSRILPHAANFSPGFWIAEIKRYFCMRNAQMRKLNH